MSQKLSHFLNFVLLVILTFVCSYFSLIISQRLKLTIYSQIALFFSFFIIALLLFCFIDSLIIYHAKMNPLTLTECLSDEPFEFPDQIYFDKEFYTFLNPIDENNAIYQSIDPIDNSIVKMSIDLQTALLNSSN